MKKSGIFALTFVWASLSTVGFAAAEDLNHEKAYQDYRFQVDQAKRSEKLYRNAQQEVEEIQSDLSQAERDERDTQLEIRRSESDVFNKRREKQELEHEYDTNRQKIDEHDRELQRLEPEAERLRREKNDLERQKRSLEADIAQLNRDIEQEEIPIRKRQLVRQRDRLKDELRVVEADLDRVSTRLRSVERDISNTKSQRSRLVSRNDYCQNRIRRLDREILDLEFRIQNLERDASRLEQTQRDLSFRLSQARRDRDSRRRDWENDKHLANQKLTYYQTVKANYDRAVENIKRQAEQQAARDGKKEADERILTRASEDGKKQGAKLGQEKGEKDRATRDRTAGYQQGRNADKIEGFFKTGYEQGKALAKKHATEKDYAETWNLELEKLGQRQPAFEKEVTAEVTAQVEGSASNLKLTKKVPAELEAPSYPVPEPFQPSAPQPQKSYYTFPSTDKRHANPQCLDQRRAEFLDICRRQYQEHYVRIFDDYVEKLYPSAFNQAFSQEGTMVYDQTMQVKDLDQMREGQEKGSLHAGILEGFSQSIAGYRAEQRSAAVEGFAAAKKEGYYLRLQSAQISKVDGVLAPGEVASMELVIDNLGESVPADFRIQLESQSLKEKVSVDFQNLPPLEGDTRTSIKGLFPSKVLARFAGEKVVLQGSIQANGEVIPFRAEQEAHFPLELEKVTIDSLSLSEFKVARFQLRNRSTRTLVDKKVALDVAPVSIKADAEPFTLESLEPDQTVEWEVPLQATRWAGGNTYSFFRSRVAKEDGPWTTQGFPLVAPVDRHGSIHVFTRDGQAMPERRLTVKAGQTVTIRADFVFHATAYKPGPFVIRKTLVSHPEIKNAAGTNWVNLGSYSPKSQSRPYFFSYRIPKSMAGQSAWVALQLEENRQPIHAQQIFLDIVE